MAWSLVAVLTLSGPALALETASENTSLEQRIQALEKSVGEKKGQASWADTLKISGVVEVEAGYAKRDFNDPAEDDETTGSLDLTTVELAFDADVTSQISAHVLLKYEDDDVFVDEGYVTWTGPESCPVKLTAGRMVLPFGNFDSRFVTDPLTLELGETNQGSLVMGYGFLNDKMTLDVGVFNSRAEEAGEDDTVSSYVGRLTVTPLEGISFGASYISSLAAADSFNEQVQSALADDVAGYSVFVTAVLMEKLTVAAEVVAAVGSFEAGEIYDGADTKKRTPKAWNIELGYSFADNLDAALRYSGSKDGDAGIGEFLPEIQAGAVLNWGVVDKTSLSLEYLHSRYEGDYMDADTVTAKLAVEF